MYDFPSGKVCKQYMAMSFKNFPSLKVWKEDFTTVFKDFPNKKVWKKDTVILCRDAYKDMTKDNSMWLKDSGDKSNV